jgi:hypothetical protein
MGVDMKEGISPDTSIEMNQVTAMETVTKKVTTMAMVTVMD